MPPAPNTNRARTPVRRGRSSPRSARGLPRSPDREQAHGRPDHRDRASASGGRIGALRRLPEERRRSPSSAFAWCLVRISRICRERERGRVREEGDAGAEPGDERAPDQRPHQRHRERSNEVSERVGLNEQVVRHDRRGDRRERGLEDGLPGTVRARARARAGSSAGRSATGSRASRSRRGGSRRRRSSGRGRSKRSARAPLASTRTTCGSDHAIPTRASAPGRFSIWSTCQAIATR